MVKGLAGSSEGMKVAGAELKLEHRSRALLKARGSLPVLQQRQGEGRGAVPHLRPRRAPATCLPPHEVFHQLGAVAAVVGRRAAVKGGREGGVGVT